MRALYQLIKNPHLSLVKKLTQKIKNLNFLDRDGYLMQAPVL